MKAPIKVMSVFGTRPEATKMCPLVKALEKDERVESIVCVTAQHREMLDQVLDFFRVVPDYDLNIMKAGQTLSQITGGVIEGISKVVREAKPDLVLVHGDTTTSFAAALGAFYEKVPVGHVEAGLRTYDKYSPFPEEMNRCLTGRIADIHFSPTELNRDNLAREGITKEVYVTGNTALDAFKYTVNENYSFKSPELAAIDFKDGKRNIVMTAHRRENLGTGIENICKAVLRLANDYPDLRFIYPVHLNPAVRNTVFPILGGHDRIVLCDPVEVTDMHNMMQFSYMCMSDSGGIQEEAPSFGLPVLVLRTETERPEAVSAGTVKVVGIDEDNIYNEAVRLLTDRQAYDSMSNATNPYGDGHASEKIIDAICNSELFNK